MKYFNFLFTLLFISSLSGQVAVIYHGGEICEDAAYEVIFEDNFDRDHINQGRWTRFFDNNDNGIADNSEERVTRHPESSNCEDNDDCTKTVYQDDNVVVSDGTLKLIAKNENVEWFGESYTQTSGMLRSKRFFFGSSLKFEIRCKMPDNENFLKAFWAYGHVYNEIDIFETSDFKNHHMSIHNWNVEDPSIVCSDRHNLNISDGEWHTYSVEYDPYFITFFIDDEQVYRISKLKQLWGPKVTNCDIPFRMYRKNECFLTEERSMSLFLNLDPGPNWLSDQPEASEFPEVWEIDYVKVYKRQEPCKYYENFVSVTENETWNNLSQKIKVLTLEKNVTLNLNDCKIEFPKDGQVILNDGASLIMNGTRFTSCTSGIKWKGIIAEKNAQLKIENKSKIENALVGVDLGVFSTSTHDNSLNNSASIIEINSYSSFINCDIGLSLGKGYSPSIITGDSWFSNCKTAILAYLSSGLTVDHTGFYDNRESIRAIDSYINIRDGNIFHRGDIGVSLEGTFPGASGAIIGNNSLEQSFFAPTIKVGISSMGSDHPVGLSIKNTRLSVTQSAAIIRGFNQYNISHNIIDNSENGIISASSGDNHNTINCNKFINNTHVDNLFIFNNCNTQFLSNDLQFSHNVNYGFLAATMPSEIGKIDNPAGNCFSYESLDFVTHDLFRFKGNKFKYYFTDNNTNVENCQEPKRNGRYSKFSSFVTSDRCDADKYLFNLIDPDGDGELGFSVDSLFEIDFTLHLSNQVIYLIIDELIDEIIAEGGDNPRTELLENNGLKSKMISLNEKVLDQWIRYCLLRGRLLKDDVFVDAVLSPLKIWKWQKQYFGFYISLGDYDRAEEILISLNPVNKEQKYFIDVQKLNLKRFTSVSDIEYTENELAYLKYIADSKFPVSGYALSLYRLLTGDELDLDIPFIEEFDIKKFSSVSENNKLPFKIYPNPTIDKLAIITEIDFTRLFIKDLAGRTLIETSFKNNMDLSSLEQGLYVIVLTAEDGFVSSQKFIKM